MHGSRTIGSVRTTSRDDTADVVALWRLQSTYADIVTRRAWSELATVFTPDVTIEVDTVTAAPQHLEGPDGFAAFVGPATDRFDHFEFVILNTVVEVDHRRVRPRPDLHVRDPPRGRVRRVVDGVRALSRRLPAH